MSTSPIVHIVDDDPAVRESLSWLVESVGLAVRTYESAQAFWDAYSPEQPGCLVLDLRMPGMSGLELQRQLREARIDIPIIIVTAHGDVSAAVRAMKSGAVDLIEKPYNDQLLLDRIQHAIELDATRRQDRALRDKLSNRLAMLTDRERQVMNLVVAGKANKQVAATLGISSKTVEVHRARVMHKMEAGSLADLVRYAEFVGSDERPRPEAGPQT